METKAKRFFSLTLSLIMIILATPLSSISVFAETNGDYEYEMLWNDTISITAYNGSDSNLVIPEEIDGFKVSDISSKVFANCSFLESVSIPNGIKEIGYDTFLNCTRLTKVILPNSIEKIYSRAFYGCTSLSNITIPDRVSYIADDALCETAYYNEESNWVNNVLYCGNHLIKAKTNISGSYDIKEGTITIAKKAFMDCTSLTNVNLPNSLTYINDSAFENTKLKNVIIPDKVVSIDANAFANCSSLESIYIPEHAVLGGKDGVVFPFCSQTLKIYGYKDTWAEITSKYEGIRFIALDTKKDESTGISVYEKELDILPDGAELKTEKVSNEKNKIVFDISLIRDGEEVQPNGKVKVKISVPEGMDASQCKIYRAEANGTTTNMNADYICITTSDFDLDADGNPVVHYYDQYYMIFTTDHFSKYILTTEELSSAIPGDINGDGKVTAIDARWVLQIAAGIRQVTEEEKAAVDFNKDGKVTAIDARWVLQAAAGIRVI